jgi:hypothetical protein
MSEKKNNVLNIKTEAKDGLSQNKLTLENLVTKIYRCDVVEVKKILRQKQFMVNQIYEGKTIISHAASKGFN